MFSCVFFFFFGFYYDNLVCLWTFKVIYIAKEKNRTLPIFSELLSTKHFKQMKTGKECLYKRISMQLFALKTILFALKSIQHRIP